MPYLSKSLKHFFICSALIFLGLGQAQAATNLADGPLTSTIHVPDNVALALSVEFPTAVGSAYTDNYSPSNTYLGYFDDKKCYQYDPAIALYNTGVDDNGVPLAAGTTDPHWVTASQAGLYSNYGNGPMNVVQDNLYIGSTVSYTTSKPIGQKIASAATNYYYATKFYLPSNIDRNTVVITFTLGHDDGLSFVRINGVATGFTSANLSAGDKITITLGSGNAPSTSSGPNIIEIGIHNDTGESGINIDNMKVTVGGQVARNTEGSYFVPVTVATNHTCSGLWSGNFLNWALTQTIDPFRSVLTGGYRSVDTVSKSILEKAWASGQGGTVVDKAINGNTLVQGATPYNWSNIYIRINGLGNSMAFGNQNNFGGGGNIYGTGSNTSFVALSTVDTLPNVVPSSDINTGQYLYGMDVRVKVCDATTSLGIAGLETNCVAYGNNYKPEGLIQKNALSFNFAAFGYLNDSDVRRDGGVMRARMGPVGPIKAVPGSGTSTNSTRSEWDANTGVFNTNPHTLDNAGVTNSGVINYLNKFGSSGSYKTYDPVSELYYTTLRYFRNYNNTKGNVAEYTNNYTAAMSENFPVITNWDDPIQYSCQKNYVIGIGDTNTWADANLPGSSIRSGNEPSLPAAVASDYGSVTNTSVNYTDVTTSTNRVGALEGLGNLGTLPWCCNGSTFFMAGLAYDVHTRDFRPDLTNEQTITTYWLDVLESGDRFDYSKAGMRNQFWLAAKYGGFTRDSSYVPYGTTLQTIPTSKWDTNNDGDPDNYYRANNPALMIDGLTKAFTNIANNNTTTSSAFGFSSPTIGDTVFNYTSKYFDINWTGDIEARYNGDLTTRLWSAADRLTGQNWSGRVIATSTCKTDSAVDGTQICVGQPFRYNALISAVPDTLSSTLGVTAADQQILLDYLRGDRSYEGSLYRTRTKLLGDIVNSKLVVLGPPSAGYSDSANPGYSSFVANNAGRTTMIYVGANDGMLHAFVGGASGGNELFAYVPNALFAGPNATPNTDGLAALSNKAFVHHYYVDATPQIRDVNFSKTGGADWHTMLVGGLGKGGKAYYALDVSTPASYTNEGTLANKVLWEFKHKHLGYSYGKPLMVKTKRDGWVVVLTSGYNNDDGNGYIFIVNPKDGKLISSSLITSTGGTSEVGLTTPTAYVNDARDFTADAIYVADLQGNVWRLDVTAASGSYPTPTRIASFGKAITTPPVVEIDASTSKRYVIVGTGRYLASSDLNSRPTNSIYVFLDGTDSAFFNSATRPALSNGSYVTRSDLIDNTNTLSTGYTAVSGKVGFYVDVDSYIINLDIQSAAGFILVSANFPDNNICDPQNSSRTYAFSFTSGKSVLTDSSSSTAIIPYYQYNSLTNSSAIVISNGQLNILVGYNNGTSKQFGTSLSSSQGYIQLNWREVPTSQ
jgi:type IV pilus assembly protein PilY1